MADVINQVVAVAELTPHPRNYNAHSKTQLDQLRRSLRRFGQVRSIVVQAAGAGFMVVAGHGVVEAAKAEHFSALRADVIPADWSEVQVLAYLAADNELARLGNPDEAQLAAILQDVTQQADAELAELAAGTEVRLGELLNRLAREQSAEVVDAGADEDEDALEQVQQAWGTVLGQLWRLGEHRLLCGDCTNSAGVARLMRGERAILFATDPPYLVGYTGTNHPHRRNEADNNKDWSATYHDFDWDDSGQGRALYDNFITVAQAEAILPNAAWYCWHASRCQRMVEEVWEGHGAFVHQQIIWVKDRPILTHSWYMWRHEPCFFGWIKGQEPPRRSQDYPHSVWEIPTVKSGTRPLHPTIKPTELFTLPMAQHTLPGELCYEPFAGSGSQIIAGEQLGRRVYACEIEPSYVAVILQRWYETTGQRPVLEE